MTTATLSSPVFAPARADVLRRRATPDTFLAQGQRQLEERLAAECSEIGGELGGLGDVLAEAVGTEGRGGGRWRPLLTLAAARACGARGDVLDVAVAVELTHTASLVLDDLPCMDDADLRRGQPATHRRVGSAGAILLSVGILARASELLGRQNGCGGALCADWGRTVGLAGMAGGQAMDVSAAETLRGSARRLHRRKSSVLPAFALGAGARMAGASSEVRAGLEAFGRGLGWAYQLLDDAADVAEDTRQGRASSAASHASRSARLMRRAEQRLDAIPHLDRNGRAALLTLAARVVPAPRSTGGLHERRS